MNILINQTSHELPDGATLADAGEREQTLVAEFDSDAQAAFREEFPAWMDADGFELKF